MGNSDQLNIDCSVVVPLYNEADVIEELCQRLTATMDETGLSYELILVDDGSTDNTLQLLKDIANKDSKIIVVELRRNFGQTPALAAGFDMAKGLIIISMDGDLQHMPEEIPNFLKEIDAGYDVVSGWRKHRVDNLLMRKIPSRVANWLAARISGVFPSLVRIEMSAWYLISKSTMSLFPPAEAIVMTVRPMASLIFVSALCSRSMCTFFSCPLITAYDNAVRLASSSWLISGDLSSRARSRSAVSISAAIIRIVLPSFNAKLTSAP